MVLGLGLVAMGLDQVELVLVQEVLDQADLGLAVLVALDQVDMVPALPGLNWVVLELGQVVMDQVVLVQDQAAMDLVFILLEVKLWGKESPPNQVQ